MHALYIRTIFPYFFLSLSIICMLCGCGPSAASLRRLEGEIAHDRAKIKGLQHAYDVAETYHEFLRKGRGDALLISKGEIAQAIKSMLPYTYRGRELSRQYLAGEISFVKMSDLRLLPGNRARVFLYFDGRKLKTKKVPSYARSQVRSLKRAARAGRLEVEVTAFVHNQKRILVLDPEVISVQFKQENTGSNRSRFLDAVRKKIFNGQKRIPLPKGLRGTVKVLTTPHHLVFMSK